MSYIQKKMRFLEYKNKKVQTSRAQFSAQHSIHLIEEEE